MCSAVNTTVKNLSVYFHANNLGGKVWNPAIRWKTKFAVFIVVENEQGVQGLGECWCFDSAPDTLVAYLRTEVLPHFVGCALKDAPSVFERLVNRATLTARHGLLASALSGIDIALSDMAAKIAKLPLHSSLNKHSTNTVFTYASGGLYGENKDNAALCSEMNSMAGDGFSVLKMKIGALSIEQDLGRIHAVLESLPVHVNLIIDGVYSYTVESAKAVFNELPASRIVAFQSPLPAHDISGMAVLNDAGVPVMATEAEYRTEIHQQLIERNAVTYLQTAPVSSGGMRGVESLHQLVKETPVKLSLEVSSTSVAFMAAAHLAAAYDTVAHVEYHYVHQVFFEQLTGSSREIEMGSFTLPKTFGLGVELDLNQVEKACALSSK